MTLVIPPRVRGFALGVGAVLHRPRPARRHSARRLIGDRYGLRVGHRRGRARLPASARSSSPRPARRSTPTSARRRRRPRRTAAGAGERGPAAKLLVVPRPRRALRQRAGALQRRLRRRRGRDPRPARHQRRRQVDAAARHLRHHRAVATAPSPSTARTSPTCRRTSTRDRGIVDACPAARRLPVAHRAREPPARRVDVPRRRRRTSPSATERGASASSRSCASGSTTPRGQPVRRRAADAHARPGVPARGRGC